MDKVKHCVRKADDRESWRSMTINLLGADDTMMMMMMIPIFIGCLLSVLHHRNKQELVFCIDPAKIHLQVVL